MATMIHRIRIADRARHEKLDQLLGQQDTILRNRKQILRDSLPTGTSGVIDVEEHSLDAEEQRVGFSVLELTSRTVQEIETALRRLEAGEFGTCSDCRSRIPATRLRALPFAALCRGCQEKRDIAAVAVAGWAAAGWKERVASTRALTAGIDQVEKANSYPFRVALTGR
jgi:RNA polymerase-binding transcription factor DksA